MPLIQGKSKKSFSENVRAEMDSGKPQKQSLAIAYSIMRKNRKKKMAEGGMVEEEQHDSDLEHIDDLPASDFPREPKDHYSPDEEDLPDHMMARGGMLHAPHKIARGIMIKKMSKGGMYPTPKDAMYADGGYVDLNSDSEADSLPVDDEDDVDIPFLGYDSAREDTEGQHDRAMEVDDKENEHPEVQRKRVLSGIMKSLHARHYGR